MIVVVASSYDAYALSIVAHWQSGYSTMLTAEDLCSPGWSISVPRSGRGAAVIGGRIVRPDQISGILTLRPRVFAPELRAIHPDDRAYVAAELNAFLLEWLMAQSCPVLNRPSLSCLAGPDWRVEQWIHIAGRLGVPVRTRRRHVRNDCSPRAEEPAVEIILVGERCFGCDDPRLQSWSRRLAEAAGTDLLCTRFSLPEGDLLSAHSWPRLTDPAVLAAVRARLGGEG
ncbi:MAG TPA: hypothetical protein VIY49_21105 [Bryobacteraceae bacterium]